MGALVAFFLSNPAFLGLIAAVLGGLGVGVYQRRAGAKANEAKHAAADAAAVTEGQKIDDAVAGRAPDDNRGRLATWSKS